MISCRLEQTSTGVFFPDDACWILCKVVVELEVLVLCSHSVRVAIERPHAHAHVMHMSWYSHYSKVSKKWAIANFHHQKTHPKTKNGPKWGWLNHGFFSHPRWLQMVTGCHQRRLGESSEARHSHLWGASRASGGKRGWVVTVLVNGG